MLDKHLRPEPSEVLKVTDLTRQIKRQLEGRFRQFWVRGEVSNLRKQSSGHVYFSLKDSGSQLPCVLFARDAARQSFELREGMELVLFGDVSVYEPHGRYQFIAKIAIESGEGQLQLEFERLKRKLAGEGLFDRGTKRPLPLLPLRIAVITSPTGAAVRDFLRILKRRHYHGTVVILPARVQGEAAPAELRQMLQVASASQPAFDLIVLTRGGGSIEDLWAFNHEQLARDIATCPIPVISAVGHEIDHVLTDYVADERAETPSGAAERISSIYLDCVQRVEAIEYSLTDSTTRSLEIVERELINLDARLQIIAPARQIQLRSMQLDDQAHRMSTSLRQRLSREKDQLANLGRQLAQHHPATRTELARQQLKNLQHRLRQGVGTPLARKSDRISHLAKRLENGNLQATLKRGYSLISNKDGDIIDSRAKLPDNEAVTVRFHDGKAKLQPEQAT
ncbi:exodeoxyribonuclease VII large subunit [Coraliomargarita akajimensis]|uniref:Exodeoxyribonuclease 7 large subunit n=1 Tax=Coraliomargarita akajimensis (strain DSM 45221 / IAM 15411 / JCM 23193 / KCTC 12865 / 04OKA010-24) TaxID=583355 RepID=D5EHT6_CORAD|nr:exodeoxyribonuclease VII large subunit [Coraliomargarita akajimensis]ADE54127.1 exodeoxyribonuclease VII, large subunit [Coraliomargarita akajimensis DSM 45221]